VRAFAARYDAAWLIEKNGHRSPHAARAAWLDTTRRIVQRRVQQTGYGSVVDATMVRMKRKDRERQILEGAIKFFSEHGFAGQTRELARQLGVTQPLLYVYFPSKQTLIERVYQELFLTRWRPEWETRLADRTLPLGQRMVSFYQEFQATIFSREWVRMFVYAGLSGLDYNRRTLERLETRIFRRVCVELRVHAGYPEPLSDQITAGELEYVWQLHGRLFYYNMRQHVYGLPARVSPEGIIEMMMDDLLGGSPAVLERLIGPPPGPAAAPSRRAAQPRRRTAPEPTTPLPAARAD
jgi:AcrR family transcriptional regulator